MPRLRCAGFVSEVREPWLASPFSNVAMLAVVARHVPYPRLNGAAATHPKFFARSTVMTFAANDRRTRSNCRSCSMNASSEGRRQPSASRTSTPMVNAVPRRRLGRLSAARCTTEPGSPVLISDTMASTRARSASAECSRNSGQRTQGVLNAIGLARQDRAVRTRGTDCDCRQCSIGIEFSGRRWLMGSQCRHKYLLPVGLRQQPTKEQSARRMCRRARVRQVLPRHFKLKWLVTD